MEVITEFENITFPPAKFGETLKNSFEFKGFSIVSFVDGRFCFNGRKFIMYGLN